MNQNYEGLTKISRQSNVISTLRNYVKRDVTAPVLLRVRFLRKVTCFATVLEEVSIKQEVKNRVGILTFEGF